MIEVADVTEFLSQVVGADHQDVDPVQGRNPIGLGHARWAFDHHDYDRLGLGRLHQLESRQGREVAAHERPGEGSAPDRPETANVDDVAGLVSRVDMWDHDPLRSAIKSAREIGRRRAADPHQGREASRSGRRGDLPDLGNADRAVLGIDHHEVVPARPSDGHDLG